MFVRSAKTLLVLSLLCGTVVAAADAGVWLDVPFVKQEKNGCGAASIAMLMQYWRAQQNQPAGDTADAASIQRELYSKPAHGIYASDVERYLQDHGFRTFAFRGDWADLKQHLEKGRPLVVALKPSSVASSLHYVVVTGLDPNQKAVLVNDPAQRKLLKEDQSSFEREWKAAGQWTLLALPQPDTN
jgi:ABC-type bacteriocin/lantibiotic exporter with double-glycine peptidase domain